MIVPVPEMEVDIHSRMPFDQRTGGGRDATLDGFRAIAVAAVVVGHALTFRFDGYPFAIPLQWFAPTLSVTGVQIFFLISGFVITRLLIIEEDRNGSVDLKAFYIRRFFRIFPPLAVYLSVVATLAFFDVIEVSPVSLISGATFTCNTGLASCGWFVGHLWTLSVEEQFYLIWPTLFVVMATVSRPTLLLCLIVVLCSIAIARDSIFNGNDIAFSLIAFGCLVAAAPSIQRTILARVTPLVWIICAMSLLAAQLMLSDRAMVLIKPVLLVVLVFGAANWSVLRSLLGSRPFQAVGLTSYGTYLWQQIFLARPEKFSGSPPELLLLPIAIAACWYLIERPSIKLGRRFSSRVYARERPLPAP